MGFFFCFLKKNLTTPGQLLALTRENVPTSIKYCQAHKNSLQNTRIQVRLFNAKSNGRGQRRGHCRLSDYIIGGAQRKYVWMKARSCLVAFAVSTEWEEFVNWYPATTPRKMDLGAVTCCQTCFNWCNKRTWRCCLGANKCALLASFYLPIWHFLVGMPGILSKNLKNAQPSLFQEHFDPATCDLVLIGVRLLD